MYVLIILSFVAAGSWVVRRGLREHSRRLVYAGAAVILATVAFFGSLSLWGEMLWFDALGYRARFWTFINAQAALAAIGATGGGVIAFLLAWLSGWRPGRRIAALVGAAGGIVWGLTSWHEALMFLYGVPAGVNDPIFEQDAGFYMFSLSFYDKLLWLLLYATLVGTLANAAALLPWDFMRRASAADRDDRRFLPLILSSLSVAIVLAWGHVLAAYHLLYSTWGVVAGPGWTDVHARLPGYLFSAVAVVLLAALPLVPSARRAIGGRFARFTRGWPPALAAVAAVWTTFAFVWIVALGIAPGLTQSLLVAPNEITYEQPYIAHNIDFTRRAFHLNKMEERQFPPVGAFTPDTVERNRHVLSEVRLWDWRALDEVYKQFQEIRLYYEFRDVDIDRYTLGDRYRQVWVAARELEQANLPPQSQTFVNQRFKFTHGYGLTLATVSDFTPEGLPNLLLKDIPPQAAFPELEVERPEIYYGELTHAPVVVNSTEEEFDYPSGEKNAYIRYSGRGGVEMKGLWRKFLFGWKFDGTSFLLSRYPKADSRVMFHREVRGRVARVAPFLILDGDPYIVLANGRLYWIIDCYTTSRYFPYSEPFLALETVHYRTEDGPREYRRWVAQELRGANYVRNSVKAVVDAFEGTVDLYVFDPDDPVIRTWQRILPGMLKSRDAMPDALRAHVRYPQDFLLAQSQVYAKYHMTDPVVFYNQEDLWVRATETYYGRVLPVEPYYVMWEPPGSDRAEFVLIQPFTPKGRQVLIGWMAGLSDGDNYGRFLAYQFTKESRVLGPQQVETKIDQDPVLSAQLTLWDQRGSTVIRGNVLAIPIDDSLIYVEPIYIRAETAAYPELRLVVVMHGDTMSYAPTFDEALAGLFESVRWQPGKAVSAAPGESLGRQANEAFEAYLTALGAQRFEEASRQLERLRDLLAQLAGGDSTP
jgi:uncharacterized membrane protein (UPF0182 family)